MNIGLMYVVLAGLTWTAIGIAFSKVANKEIDSVVFITVAAFFTMIFSVPMVRWQLVSSEPVTNLPPLIILMLISGAFNMLASYVMLIAMGKGHNGYTWAIGQSAMLIPFLMSIVIWRDAVSVSGIIGMTLMLVMVITLGACKSRGEGDKKQSYSRLWLILSLIVFLLYGIQQTINTIPTRWYDWNDTLNLRVPLSFTGGFIFQLILLLFSKRKITKPSVIRGFFAAILIVVGGVFIFLAIDNLNDYGLLPIVYPLAISISIMGVSLYSVAYLKENFKFLQIVGLLVGFIGIVLVSI